MLPDLNYNNKNNEINVLNWNNLNIGLKIEILYFQYNYFIKN